MCLTIDAVKEKSTISQFTCATAVKISVFSYYKLIATFACIIIIIIILLL